MTGFAILPGAVTQTLVRRLSRIRVPTWLGPCASLLCLVHCFAVPILLVFLPGLSVLVGKEVSHHLDLLFWTMATSLGGRVLFQIKSSMKPAFFAIATIGLAGFFLGHENLFHICLFVLAIIQLVAVVYKHRSQRQHPACCEHEGCHSGGGDNERV